MVTLHDRATITGQPRITRDGYFVADALVARADNVQTYYASELQLTDRAPNDVIRVFRPAAEVFAKDSLATLAHCPVTLDHPSQMVDATNHSALAKGHTGDEVLREGDFIRVPLRVTDAAAVESVRTDRREFSCGYAVDIRMEPGTSPAGEAYDAVAGSFRYNHLAAVRAARGGTELRIVDERPPATGAKPVKIVMVDGLPVNAEDANSVEITLNRLIADRDSAVNDLAAARGTIAERDTVLVAKDAEIQTLKDQATAATLTPAQLRDAAASFDRTVKTARALGAVVTDAMDEPAVVAAAVKAKMGDKASGYSPDHMRVAFDTLAAALPAGAQPQARDQIAAVLGDGPPVSIGDAQAAFDQARAARFGRFETAHRASPTVQ